MHIACDLDYVVSSISVAMPRLILLRHGQSLWNLENRFTGWTDVDLSQQGRDEARHAGEKILAAGLVPDFYFTSYLKRAIHTLQIVADTIDRCWVPVIKDWHLNERHYGALQGLDKAETARRYGDDQVHLWRRSYDVMPPALTPDDERYPGNMLLYASLSSDQLPLTESLQTTVARVGACWEELIAPHLHLYDTILVVAHGNSLRALAMMLLHMSPLQVVGLEIPTGAPWLFELDCRLAVTANHYM